MGMVPPMDGSDGSPAPGKKMIPKGRLTGIIGLRILQREYVQVKVRSVEIMLVVSFAITIIACHMHLT
jgi:hypothetical protein